MSDPSQMRISDADRHQVSELLRDAAGEGRIDPDELEDRIEATYAAKIYSDLVPIVADIPGEAPTPKGLAIPRDGGPALPPERRPAPSTAPVPHHDSSFAVMSGVERTGAWQVGERHTVFTLMGGAEIDLREAHFTSSEVVIYANAVMGGIEITVNAWTQVIVDGVGIMGGFAQGKDKVEPQIDASSPVVRVKGVALMGGVDVTRKPMPGEKKRRRRRGELT